MEIQALHQLFINSTGISTDTRAITSDSIFFALKGANFNGNLFADSALESGAKYAVVDDPEVAKDPRSILVGDVLKTLQDLANYHRHQFDIPVIGITGSNGKTTSKELIGEVLKQSYNVLMTTGNLNNHLGVPFTLLRLTEKHDIAIIEMGANKPGDIKELVDIAAPTHGIITNIGTAHIEGFGSLEGVVKTKSELYVYLAQEKGTIFYNNEDETLVSVLPKNIETIAYGTNSGLVNGHLIRLTPFVEMEWSNANYESPLVQTQLVGKYNFTNFLAAICIGQYFKVPEQLINQALNTYTPTNNRSQVAKTARNTLIVDCYNANPSSMASALDSFFEIEAEDKMVCLGDMLELGDIAIAEHLKIIDMLTGKGVTVYLVGDIFSGIETSFKRFKTVEDLQAAIDLQSVKDRLILLKGSRGIKLEQLITLL